MWRAPVLFFSLTLLILVSCYASHKTKHSSQSGPCYQVVMGPWLHNDKVELAETCRVRFHLSNEGQVRIIETSCSGQLPYIGKVGKWSLRGNEYEITWATGLVVTKVTFSVANSAVVGTATYFTDTGWALNTTVSGGLTQCQ